MSKELESCTRLEFFPYAVSVYRVIAEYEPFKEALKQLCAQENPSDDVLNGIAVLIGGLWWSVDRPHGISINELAEKIKVSPINTILDSNRKISDECKAILDSIPDFSYHIKGKNIVWESIHSKNNSTKWSKDLELKIIERSPRTAKDIFKIL